MQKKHKQSKSDDRIPHAKFEILLYLATRPTVEYLSSVWDCYRGKNIVQVEMV